MITKLRVFWVEWKQEFKILHSICKEALIVWIFAFILSIPSCLITWLWIKQGTFLQYALFTVLFPTFIWFSAILGKYWQES